MVCQEEGRPAATEGRRESRRTQRCRFVQWEQGSFTPRDTERKEGRKKEPDRGAGRKRRRRPHKGLAEQQLPRGSESSYTLILTRVGPERKEKLSKKRQKKQQKNTGMT